MPPLRCGVACDADRHNHEWLTPLYNSPEIAAPLLQRLDAQGNIHGKYMLVDDLHVLLRNDALTDGHHEQFFKSGVLSTLLQMLLYDHSYATYEYPIPPQQYIGAIMCCATWLAARLINTEQYKTAYGKECARSVLPLIPSLWSYLWKKRDFFWDPERNFNLASEEGRRRSIKLSYMIMFLLTQYTRLARIADPDTPVPQYGDDARLALYAWTHGADSRLQDDMIQVLFARVDIFEGASELFKEVVVNTGSLTAFSTTVKTVLMKPDVVNESLLVLLNLMYPAFQGCDDLVSQRPEGMNELGLLEVISFSLQRQLCCGSARLDSDIMVYALAAVSVLLQNLSLPHVKVAVTKVNELELLKLSALVYSPAAAKDDIRFREMVIPILKTYGMMGHAHRTSLPEPRALAKEVVNAARTVWLPTLQKLRDLNIPPRSPQYRWVQDWMDFGKHLNFRESIEHRLYERHMAVPPVLPKNGKHCHWKDCLCSEKTPKHPLRICMGCMRVYYCSSRCQTSDWKNGGHRERCRGRRTNGQ
ncbi:unnamed protein product [Somion occarium]|uniref:MYND-type domain-containing protein n=2 Tax=Somion occarium TaxID=3059160 RepID=A0ABP1CMG6_9APHY